MGDERIFFRLESYDVLRIVKDIMLNEKLKLLKNIRVTVHMVTFLL